MEKRGAQGLLWPCCLLLHWSKVLIGSSDARWDVTLKVRLLKMLWWGQAFPSCPVARSSCHHQVWRASKNIFSFLEKTNSNALHLLTLLITWNHQIWLFCSSPSPIHHGLAPPHHTCVCTRTLTCTQVRLNSMLGSWIISLGPSWNLVATNVQFSLFPFHSLLINHLYHFIRIYTLNCICTWSDSFSALIYSLVLLLGTILQVQVFKCVSLPIVSFSGLLYGTYRTSEDTLKLNLFVLCLFCLFLL